jgi:hypothetical protein
MHEECFICLENLKNEKYNEIELKCCKNKIHDNCLVHLFLYNHDKCPLCRNYLDIYNYVSKKEFSNIIRKSEIFSISFSPKITEFYINYTFRNYFVLLFTVYTIFILLIVMYILLKQL